MKTKSISILLLIWAFVSSSISMNIPKPQSSATTNNEFNKFKNLQPKSDYTKYGMISVGVLGLLGATSYYVYNKLNSKDQSSTRYEQDLNSFIENANNKTSNTNNINDNGVEEDVEGNFFNFLKSTENQKHEQNATNLEQLILSLKKPNYNNHLNLDNFSYQVLITAFLKSLESSQAKIEHAYPILEEALLEGLVLLEFKAQKLAGFLDSLNQAQKAIFYKAIEKFKDYLKQNIKQEQEYQRLSSNLKNLSFNELFTKLISTLSTEQWEIENVAKILVQISDNPTMLYESNAKDFSSIVNTLNFEQNIIKDLMIKKFVLKNLYNKLNIN